MQVQEQIKKIVPLFLYMALNVVFLASYADKEINEIFKKYENRKKSPTADDFGDDYADYLQISLAGSCLIIFSFFLIAILKFFQNKVFAIIIVFILTIAIILIIIGMDIGSDYYIRKFEYYRYNLPIAFGFGQIALYIIGCIQISLIMYKKELEIRQSQQRMDEILPQLQPQSQQSIGMKDMQQVPNNYQLVIK